MSSFTGVSSFTGGAKPQQRTPEEELNAEMDALNWRQGGNMLKGRQGFKKSHIKNKDLNMFSISKILNAGLSVISILGYKI